MCGQLIDGVAGAMTDSIRIPLKLPPEAWLFPPRTSPLLLSAFIASREGLLAQSVSIVGAHKHTHTHTHIRTQSPRHASELAILQIAILQIEIDRLVLPRRNKYSYTLSLTV